MNKIVLTIIILLVLVGAGWIMWDKDINTPEKTEIPQELVSYFAEKIATTAISITGVMPVEGFDAQMLVDIYPGLERKDFDSVPTMEGVYNFSGGQLIYIRTASGPISSAETTVSQEGYGLLLEKLARKYNEKINSTSDIDGIIEDLLDPSKYDGDETSATSADNAPEGSMHNLPVPDAVAAVRSKVAIELGVEEGLVIIMSAHEQEWPDACLGLPAKDEMCAQVITPGYEVAVRADGKTYVYRTNSDGSVIRKE